MAPMGSQPKKLVTLTAARGHDPNHAPFATLKVTSYHYLRTA